MLVRGMHYTVGVPCWLNQKHQQERQL